MVLLVFLRKLLSGKPAGKDRYLDILLIFRISTLKEITSQYDLYLVNLFSKTLEID